MHETRGRVGLIASASDMSALPEDTWGMLKDVAGCLAGGQLDSTAATLITRSNSPDSDVTFISCTSFSFPSAAESLAGVTSRPVVRNDLAGARSVLRQSGIADMVPGSGPRLSLPAIARALAV